MGYENQKLGQTTRGLAEDFPCRGHLDGRIGAEGDTIYHESSDQSLTNFTRKNHTSGSEAMSGS